MNLRGISRYCSNEIGDNASRLLPLLNRMDPKNWVAKGASETYVEQWQSSRDQVRALADGAKALAKNPERLSISLELFFRMESLEGCWAPWKKARASIRMRRCT